MSRASVRGGYTLTETVVVIAIVGILGGAAAVLGGGAAAGGESAARSTLWEAWAAQASAIIDTGDVAGADTVTAYHPGATYIAGESAAADEISIHRDGSTVTLAVAADTGACWAVRIQAVPTAGDQTVWAVVEAGGTTPCDAAVLDAAVAAAAPGSFRTPAELP